MPDAQAPQSIRHGWLSDSAVNCEVFDSASASGEVVSTVTRDVGSKPHIGSVISGRGFGFASPESQCSDRSEEHTSALQSQSNLVCRLLLEKKNEKPNMPLLCIYHVLIELQHTAASYTIGWTCILH